MKSSTEDNSIIINLVRRNLLLLLFASTQFIPLYTFSQALNTDKELISLIDSTQKLYGNSDLLINGSIYYQPNRLATGDPYLFSQEIEKGVIYTRGVTFNDAYLNYDIENQKLLLLHIKSNGSRLLISLSDILVDSFLIRDNLFVSSASLNIENSYPYLLSINSNKYPMYAGFKKEFISQFDERYPFGRHSKKKRTLFLILDSIPKRINSTKSFLKTFPEARKELSAYFRQHKIDLSEATIVELKKLMEYYNYQRKLTNEQF